uniref:von Willebrand factor C domain-containing protein 2-like n=1 Tax=Petromyzon marinus TaxID=7757 RepID=A0AAJ7SN12_PETMA|nr:von Willebrand factor C domain-containing protein 2-like [Petromyzon marinus]
MRALPRLSRGQALLLALIYFEPLLIHPLGAGPLSPGPRTLGAPDIARLAAAAGLGSRGGAAPSPASLQETTSPGAYEGEHDRRAQRGCEDATGRVFRLGERFFPGHASCPCVCAEDGPVCAPPECPRLHPKCVRVESDGCCQQCKQVRSGCDFKGAKYGSLQEFKLSPCERCRCEADGEVTCVVSDCPLPECVDPVYEPKQCCPVCKHGPNCLAGSNVIPAGREVKVDECTTCNCNFDGDWYKTDRQATCIHDC